MALVIDGGDGKAVGAVGFAGFPATGVGPGRLGLMAAGLGNGAGMAGDGARGPGVGGSPGAVTGGVAGVSISPSAASPRISTCS